MSHRCQIVASTTMPAYTVRARRTLAEWTPSMSTRRSGFTIHTAARHWGCAVAILAVPCLLGGMLVFLPGLSPPLGADTADFLRLLVGPEPVAQLESVAASMRDTLYRAVPAINGSGPAVTWSGGVDPTLEVLFSTPASTLTPTAQTTSIVPDSGPASTPGPTLSVVSAPPDIGWQVYGPTDGGSPLLARALIMVDPARSYAGVALVRMDLSQLELHIMAGFLEPAHPSGIDEMVPGLGMVLAQDQAALVAAFNGGFKAAHGHYGMMLDGITLLPPVDGMATLAVYEDGSLRLGAWGRAIIASPDMVAFRQNCPPLIEQGQINPGLVTKAQKAWGMTNNADVTWRTAVGLSEDRRYLIYAVGNGTSVEFLARALQAAGASDAMQLDINQYYAHFVTYSPANEASSASAGGLQAQRLLEQMINIRHLYLTPYPRDFFYLTHRP